MGENRSEAPKVDGRGENLSEALKVDGKGENPIEAPLLSFKKQKNKKTKKTGTASSQCGNACRLQVFYEGKEVLQLKDKGKLCFSN